MGMDGYKPKNGVFGKDGNLSSRTQLFRSQTSHVQALGSLCAATSGWSSFRPAFVIMLLYLVSVWPFWFVLDHVEASSWPPLIWSRA